MKLKSLVFTIFIISKTIFAAEYYCDPVNGSISNDGSKNSPWSTLEAVFIANKTFQAGDIIYLLEGYHGNPNIIGNNTDYITIINYQNSKPKLSRITFGVANSTSKWILDGIIIGAEFHTSYHKNTLLYTGVSSSFIKVKNCEIYTKEDISSWALLDWNSNVSNGVIFNGSNCSIENSTVKNIRTGIQFEGDNCTASNNKILNFAGDGMRGLANNGVFEYNLVQDNYVIDSNHDDGFQSWTNDGGVGKGTLKNIILRGNTFINYTDATRDFLGPMQGVFGTDGMFEDFIIENNIVITDHWHGISLYGATNCTIINNTVIDTYFGVTYPSATNPLGPSWIRVSNHKNGTQSTGNVIRNNITNQIVLDTGVGVEDHNLTLTGNSSADYDNNFVDWKNFNTRLIQNSQAIDIGSNSLAPNIDADKNQRPAGNSFDVGAFEYGSLITEGETSTNIWQTFSMNSFSESFTVEFDLKPNQNNMDGVTGVLRGTANDYSNLSCIVRLNTDGRLDVYDLNTYSFDNVINYQLGDDFHIKMLVDFTNKTYDVVVSKNGESEVILANDYSFRKASSEINAWAIKKEDGSHTVKNMIFYSGVLSVDDAVLDTNFEIFPTLNSNGKFKIRLDNKNLEDLKITLFDLNGRKIETTYFSQSRNLSTFKLNTYPQLDSGIYLILLQNSSKYQLIKIYKSK